MSVILNPDCPHLDHPGVCSQLGNPQFRLAHKLTCPHCKDHKEEDSDLGPEPVDLDNEYLDIKVQIAEALEAAMVGEIPNHEALTRIAAAIGYPCDGVFPYVVDGPTHSNNRRQE